MKISCRRIYSHRFAEKHQLDAEALLNDLDKLTLHNAGPELSIPEARR